jgi:hypothetical protein
MLTISTQASQKQKMGEQVFCWKNNVTALQRRDKSDVWVLSSRHTAQTKDAQWAREEKDETTGHC